MGDIYVLITTAAGMFIGVRDVDLGNEMYILKDPLSYGEILQQDQQTGQIVAAQPALKLPHMVLQMPDSLKIGPVIIYRELDKNKEHEGKLIALYKSQLQVYKAQEAGLVAPTDDEVRRIGR